MSENRDLCVWVCVWVGDYAGYWQTTCGNAFEFTEGGPTDNRVKFCMYCGREVVEEAEAAEEFREAGGEEG